MGEVSRGPGGHCHTRLAGFAPVEPHRPRVPNYRFAGGVMGCGDSHVTTALRVGQSAGSGVERW